MATKVDFEKRMINIVIKDENGFVQTEFSTDDVRLLRDDEGIPTKITITKMKK